jgi:hypothetical protein
MHGWPRLGRETAAARPETSHRPLHSVNVPDSSAPPSAALTTLGAHVLLSPDDATVRRFRDPFGIDAEVVA